MGSDKVPQKDAYAGFFQPVFDTRTSLMKLKCLIGGCASKPISYMVYYSQGKTKFPFTNAMTHLEACGGPRVLRREESQALIQRLGQKAALLGAAAGGAASSAPSTGKRGRDGPSVDDHLGYLGIGENICMRMRCYFSSNRALATSQITSRIGFFFSRVTSPTQRL